MNYRLGLEVVAEGVQDPLTKDLLDALECVGSWEATAVIRAPRMNVFSGCASRLGKLKSMPLKTGSIGVTTVEAKRPLGWVRMTFLSRPFLEKPKSRREENHL